MYDYRRRVAGRCAPQMKMLEKNLELRRKQEIHEIEERKNTHINELMKKHEKAFAEIKNYYNDITHNNLDLIKTLKVGEGRGSVVVCARARLCENQAFSRGSLKPRGLDWLGAGLALLTKALHGRDVD